MITRFTVGHCSHIQAARRRERGRHVAKSVLPPSTRFTVGHTFVRPRFLTFCQLWGSDRGYSLGSCPLRHSPVSLADSEKGGLFLITVLRGLGLFIVEIGFIPDRFLTVINPDSYSPVCPTLGLWPPDLPFLTEISAVSRVLKVVF